MRDRIVNTLKLGQMVQLTIPEHTLIAQVQQLSDGGLLGGKDGMRVPAQLILIAVIPLTVQSGEPVHSVVVLQNPPEPSTSKVFA